MDTTGERPSQLPIQIHRLGPGDSALTFALRLGGYSSTNTGIVWFDDAFLELVEDDVYAVFKGQHVTLMLFKSDADMISDVPGWLQKLDMAYELLEELVGSSPYNGEKITVREVLPCWFGGLAGNPILINQQVLQIEKFNNPNDLDFGVIHELAHDFDIPPYSEFYIGDGAINAEGWSNLKVLYVADQMASLFPIIQSVTTLAEGLCCFEEASHRLCFIPC